MNLNNSLIKLTAFFNKLLKLLLPLVAVSLLLGIIFGPTTPFVGDVYKNVTDILSMLGEDALLVVNVTGGTGNYTYHWNQGLGNSPNHFVSPSALKT